MCPMDIEVDDINKVPEKFRTLYTKDATTNKFKLDADLTKDLDNTGLTTALDKERKRAKDFEKQLGAWKGVGVGETPEEAMTRIKEMGADDMSADEQKTLMRKLKSDHEAATAKIKTEYEGKLSKKDQALKERMIDSEASLAIAELKGSAALLMPIVQKKCLLVEENGVQCVRIVDDEGDPRGNGKGGYMTIKEFIAELRSSTDYGRAFEPSGKEGSGTRAQGSAGRGDPNQKLTPMQKISAGLRNRR